jgi:hypothetical protein
MGMFFPGNHLKHTIMRKRRSIKSDWSVQFMAAMDRINYLGSVFKIQFCALVNPSNGKCLISADTK